MTRPGTDILPSAEIFARNLDNKVGGGEGGAGVDVAIVYIRPAAQFVFLGDVDRAGNELASAPAAFAAAAVGGRLDPGALNGDQHRLLGGGTSTPHSSFLTPNCIKLLISRFRLPILLPREIRRYFLPERLLPLLLPHLLHPRPQMSTGLCPYIQRSSPSLSPRG